MASAVPWVTVALRWSVTGALALLLLRRLLLLAASMLPLRRSGMNATRSLTLLVAARDEARRLPGLLEALDRLDYPQDLVQVVLVSDGSVDETAAIMQSWRSSRFPTTTVRLDESRGKAGALAEGLARARVAELVVVFDADCMPESDVLQHLSGAFDASNVGAASAYPRPGNANVSSITRYAALERYVHHFVALAGKDRLALDPPIIGVGFAVRRGALESAGGFPAGRLSEDTELSLALVRAGWRLRWLACAVVREDVADSLARFREQRERWGRGLLQSSPRARSVEQLMTAAGYLDRLVLLAAIGLVPFGIVRPWWPLAYLGALGLSIIWALRRSGERPLLPFLLAAVRMLGRDLAISVRSLIRQVRGTPLAWGRRDDP